MVRLYTKSEVVSRISGLTVSRLETYVATECVAPVTRAGEAAFTEGDLARLKLLAELAEGFDLDEDAAGLVVGLIDQIHGLRHELRAVGEALAEEPDEVRARVIARLGRG